MKKSKLIVPALAIIAFSTAASITGTVAWFTANRQVTIKAGNYTVVKTSADLDCQLVEGFQTTVNAQDAKQINVAEGAKLTHASFDHDANSKKFTVPNADGNAIARAVTLADAATLGNTSTGLVADETNKIYYAFTYTMNVSIYYGAVAAPKYGLFIDPSASAFRTNPGEQTEPEDKTSKGFRMAFIPNVSASSTTAIPLTRVWADKQTSTNATYIASPVANDVLDTTVQGHHAPSSYTGQTLLSSTTPAANNAVPADNAVAEAALDGTYANCLGSFAYAANSKVTLSFTVVCWFEGTDPEIVSRATADEYQTVGVTLTLKAVQLSDTYQ